MHLKNFTIKIGSVPYREELVAEIYHGHEQWVEISREKEELIIQFYSPSSEKYWEFSFEEALQALELAKKKLLDMGSKRVMG